MRMNEGASGIVDLYWIPLGAGAHVVRISGKIYEAIVATRRRRPRLALYHSALEVRVPGGRFVIESAPVVNPHGEGVASSRGDRLGRRGQGDSACSATRYGAGVVARSPTRAKLFRARSPPSASRQLLASKMLYLRCRPGKRVVTGCERTRQGIDCSNRSGRSLSNGHSHSTPSRGGRRRFPNPRPLRFVVFSSRARKAACHPAPALRHWFHRSVRQPRVRDAVCCPRRCIESNGRRDNRDGAEVGLESSAPNP